MNKNVAKYLKDVKYLFPVFQMEEKLYFKNFEGTVKKEINYSLSTYQDCVNKFGEPKEVIVAYYEEMDSEVLLKRVRSQHIMRKLFYIISIIIVILSLVACGLLFKTYQDVKNNHVTEIEITTEIIK